MDTLRIQLFGDLGLFRASRRLPAFPTQIAKRLFAFLVLHRGRLYPREVVIGTFWPDRTEKVARKCLRTDIWRVRRLLEPEGVKAGTYLVVDADQVGFNTRTDHWLDVEQFESKAKAARRYGRGALPSSLRQELVEAVDLYRGDLLDGIYDDWCLLERERYKELFLNVLERLMQHHASCQEWEIAIGYGQQLLRYDALREHIHRDLMRFYYRLGNRPASISQFHECARLLKRELGIGPMQETLDLLQAIKAERVGMTVHGETYQPRLGPQDRESTPEANRALASFYSAAADLDRVRNDLLRAIGQLLHEGSNGAAARGRD